MAKVLILGAGGQIAQHVITKLSDRADADMTLYLREGANLGRSLPGNARIIEGDVLDAVQLRQAMTEQDVVYANLSGAVDQQAREIIDAMEKEGVERLIFVTSLGIYDEIPGKFGAWNREQIGKYLPPYRRAADAIEASNLDYAILRPAWLTDSDEDVYETTSRDQPFKGTEVARQAVAALIVDLLNQDRPLGRRNLGVSKPGTDGDKPTFA
ncbi:NmrA family protein [Ruegeria sp. TrichCH4B]|jgi:uncharacterized protein YbjT (DUF2867 family)|nr:NmrA family protein [Ruegeria sp. TrichCH4B]